MWCVLLSSILSVSVAVAKHADSSGTYSYPLQKISVKGLTDIKIVGVKGRLKLHGRPHGKFIGLKVQHSNSPRYADWHLSVDRRGTTLYLEVFNVAYGAQWKTEVREELWPEFNIDLDGLALPTTVGWREGSLEFTDWGADLEVSFLKGEAKVSGGKGRLTLQPVQATVAVHGHSGPLEIKGDSGRVQLQRNTGDLNLGWMNGQVSMQNCKGKLHIESGEGQLTIDNGSGELEVQLTKGSARISNFVGMVHGKGSEAKWEVTAGAPSDLNFITSTGPVDVRWKSGGARIFLTSTQGPIHFPASSFLKQADRDGKKIVEGLKSAKKMGQVFVRTNSGAIGWN